MLKDIYSFIDSPDICIHLDWIDYELTPVEAAGIIYSSDIKSLVEKQIAMRDLLQCTEDISILGSKYTLHQLIKEQLAAEEECAEEFFNDEGTQDILYICRRDSFDFAHEKTVKDCFDRIEQFHLSPDICKIFKTDLKEPKHDYPYVVVKDGMIMRYEDNRTIKHKELFESLYSYLPVPFKPGDILYFKDPQYRHDPFVYKGKRIRQRTEDDCFIEGNMEIYNVDSDGNLYTDYADDFLKAHKYYGPLDNTNALFRPLSAFLHNEIDIVLFANAYRIILDRIRSERTSKVITTMNYTEKQKNRSGINEIMW